MQQRSEETHARILQAAQQLFARSGYDAAGVAQICTAAGVSKGAFYHHFPTKQAVFLELLEGWLTGLDAQMAQIGQAAADVPNGLLQMAGLTQQVFQHAGGQLPMFLEFWRESSHEPAVWQATIAPYRRYTELFAAVMAKGVAEGSLQPVDPQRAARVLVALALGLVMQGVMDPQGAEWDFLAQDAIKMLMNGLSRRQV